MAHNLRLKVVAEGVENKQQLRHLRLLGSDEYQGYYRSKPVVAAEFERILAAPSWHEPATIPGRLGLVKS
jgi:EAL domain-containing protein (putative c-di-GMP-specific phosphodiesterase class I)